MAEKKTNVKQKIDEGWVRARVMFEIAGNPVEHIVKTLESYVEMMKKNKGIIVLNEDKGEPEFHKDENVWSTFLEAEVIVEGIERFVYICVSFTPASIEILEPKELTFTEKDLSDWLNELLSILHHVGMKHKQQKQDLRTYILNLNNLARNTILIALEKEQTREELEKKTGMNTKTIQQFLDALEKEKRVSKKGDKYHRLT